VGDITSQQLVRHCALRPQGTLCYLDEMVSWVDKIVDKNSNEDRAAWLCIVPKRETAMFSQYVLPLPTLSSSYWSEL
jgi:hypothetical protein